MTKLQSMLGVSSAAMTLAGCAGHSAAGSGNNQPAATVVPSVALTRFTQQLDSLRNGAGIPGLSVAIVQNGQVVFVRGFGYADLERRIPATEDTPYNIASVTKPMAAVVALRLMERGQLDLDRTMSTYAGFTDFCKDARDNGGIFFRDFHCDTQPLTLRHLLSMTANGVAGTRFFYNPVSYSWTSRPMMEVTGTPFSTLIAEHVFAPAGMTRSARLHRRLPLPQEIETALAKPYHVDSAGRVLPSQPPGPQGDGAGGGVISTARDIARFDVALDGGRLLTPASHRLMWTPTRAPGGEALPYGLGWFIREIRGEQIVWHTGLWEDAYSALYVKVPAKHVTLILLANSDGLRFSTPLDGAELQNSAFATAFLDAVLR